MVLSPAPTWGLSYGAVNPHAVSHLTLEPTSVRAKAPCPPSVPLCPGPSSSSSIFPLEPQPDPFSVSIPAGEELSGPLPNQQNSTDDLVDAEGDTNLQASGRVV